LGQTKNASAAAVPAYAIAGDFCRIFSKDMNQLYLLSLLLTGEREKAEQCFVSGLEDCAGESRVFKEWARSWARRVIVRNAIRMMQPTQDRAAQFVATQASGLDSPMDAVLRLKKFDRFVFVMSVLERYSDQDCKILLGCSRQDVVRARGRVLAGFAPISVTAGPGPVFGSDGIFAPKRGLAQIA
jgi:hypothetical protein